MIDIPNNPGSRAFDQLKRLLMLRRHLVSLQRQPRLAEPADETDRMAALSMEEGKDVTFSRRTPNTPAKMACHRFINT